MISNKSRQTYLKRKRRVRKTVHGTPERPRMTVFRSARHIYVQVVDDEAGQTLCQASSKDKDLASAIAEKKKTEVAEVVGQAIAERCLSKEIKKVVFDRNGFIYHGRVAKLADAARKKGLSF